MCVFAKKRRCYPSSEISELETIPSHPRQNIEMGLHHEMARLEPVPPAISLGPQIRQVNTGPHMTVLPAMNI